MPTVLEAELVATGDELMSGAISDTNGAFAAGALREAGVLVRRMSVVGDALDDMAAALREAGARARVVVVCGGLGPTEDDRTAQAAAAVAGVPLVRSDFALAHIREMFRRLGSPMTVNNEKQADLPQDAEILDNPVGTAVGFALAIGDSRMYFLPGVPHEYRKMLREQVLPRLATLAGGDVRHMVRVLRLFGIGESKLETELAGAEIPPTVAVGYRATWPELHLRLYASGPGDLAGALDAAERAIRERVDRRIYATGDVTLAQTIGELLRKRGWRLAVAESCTGGLLGATCTDAPGASDWFECGYVTYSNDSKTRFLEVSPQMLAAHGAVSREVASAMAAQARALAGVPVALSVTGIAGPAGGTPEKPVGTVWIGLATESKVTSKKYQFPYDRERVRQRSVWTALERLRRLLLELPEE
ncbi:MAG: competence/damage-inducible protein A [Candidatus Wallbacteria bacterium]|nr:competence/damage-inducible protein A [Candidatus Wallbacteria bacterium]